MLNAMLEAAMHYAQMGLAIIPLKGKRPYWDNWPEIATRDISQIEKWWSQEPKANIGIATGKKNNLFVVDIDPKHGGSESIDTLFGRNGRFQDTWTDITGSGGTHYFFRYPTFPVLNKVGLMPGIDIRGDGGQVVAPPSIHPDTGKRYMWDGLRDPWDEPLAEAPLWLLGMLEPPRERPAFRLEGPIPKGVQHHTLVSLAGAMRRMGLDEDEIFPTLMFVNAKRCQEPGPEKNIRQIAHSTMRYQPHDKGLHRMASTLWRLTREAEESERQKQQSQQDRMRPIDGLTLYRKDITPTTEVIESVLYNGVTLLAGPPKSGKSWLTLGMAIAVSSAGRFISNLSVTHPGRVSYFALEENERRTSPRLKKLVTQEDVTLQNIEFLYSLKPMESGGLADLDAYLVKARPNLVIIDTLMAFVTGDRNSRNDVFRSDYREIKALQDLAIKYETAILVVHHTNKLGGSGISAVAGSHGVTAAADAVWTLKRQPGRRAVLDMTGREIEDQSFLIELELQSPIGWYVVEQGDDVNTSLERLEILELLHEEGPLNPAKIALELGKNRGAIRMLLRKMLASGSVVNIDGTYSIFREKPEVNRYRDD